MLGALLKARTILSIGTNSPWRLVSWLGLSSPWGLKTYSLQSRCKTLAAGLSGWNGRCKNTLRLLAAFLSSFKWLRYVSLLERYFFALQIARSNRGVIFLDWYPWSSKRAKNLHKWSSISTCPEQSWNILRTFPITSPIITPGGWQEWGEIYKCKASGFSNKSVSILEPTILMVISMKSTWFERSVKVQLRPPLFKVLLNFWWECQLKRAKILILVV